MVDERLLDAAFRGATRCKIFLGYTSNLVSAGVREHIRYLVQVRCAVVCGVRCAVCGVWCVVCGVRSAVCRVW